MVNKRQTLLTMQGSGASPAFSPTDLSGIKGWYDFSNVSSLYQTDDTSTPVTADGQDVGYVTDLSGNSNHITQSNAAARFVYKTGIQNGLSVIRAAADAVLRKTTTTFSQPVWHALALINPASGEVVGDNTRFQANPTMRIYAGAFLNGPTLGTMAILLEFNGASSNIYAASTYSGNAGTLDYLSICLGDRAIAGVGSYTGDVGEYFFGTGTIASSAADILSYLNAKWGF